MEHPTVTLAERIVQHIQSLPASAQARVLDFVESIEAETHLDKGRQEEAEWSEFSLPQGLRGLEDEPSSYSPEDVKEVFS